MCNRRKGPSCSEMLLFHSAGARRSPPQGFVLKSFFVERPCLEIVLEGVLVREVLATALAYRPRGWGAHFWGRFHVQWVGQYAPGSSMVNAVSLRCGDAAPDKTVKGLYGDSSDDDADAEARQTVRNRCGQFVWPCPRQCPGSVAARREKKWLTPADLSKEQLGALFRNACNSLRDPTVHSHQ